MKFWLTGFLSFAFFIQAYAASWGSFNGHNSNHDAICIIVSSVSENKDNKTIEDLIASVQFPGSRPGTAKWVPDICHRQKDNLSEIWCDGNQDSPVFGVTYRLTETIGGPKTEQSELQYWECAKGCNSKAPQQLLYER